MTAARLASTVTCLSCLALLACGSAPPLAPASMPDDAAGPVERAASSNLSFEQRQRDRALALGRQGRLADAALAWEVLAVLRPDSSDYPERLADTRRLIEAAVAERSQRAAQAYARGDLDAAAQHYLGVLALQPEHAQAADVLRGIERERNKRQFLGKHSRVTITRRALADAGMPARQAGMALADRNELEHASLLAGAGDFDDAIGLLERRLAADRGDDETRQLLADVYHRKAEGLMPRDKAAAIAALEKSARLNPKEPTVLAKLKQLKGSSAGAASPSAVSTSRPGPKSQ